MDFNRAILACITKVNEPHNFHRCELPLITQATHVCEITLKCVTSISTNVFLVLLLFFFFCGRIVRCHIPPSSQTES